MKVAIVVQRYGEAINGGAELHARYIAEHLARHADVEVLTTCAVDYVTWRNELPAGVDRVNDVPVRRFPVDRERDPLIFGRHSDQVFKSEHSCADELHWLEAEGPSSPALIKHIADRAASYDYLIFFSYRYHHAYHGMRAAGGRGILVPTAERDPAIGLTMFKPIFRGARAVMYNSPEERAMIQAVSGNTAVPSVVVGIGSDVPSSPHPGRFRQKFNIRGPFAIYVGRIDENKGCKELFDYFGSYIRHGAGRLSLVLIGNSLLPIPEDARVRHLGFVPDSDKFDAMAAADVLIMPSYFESLSMVALEAWALGKPVIVNGHCDVLKGQAIRSNAGLYYESRAEFVETLRAVEQNRWLAATMGRSGRRFFRDNYDWPVIERKYLDMLNGLMGKPTPAMEPVPGWFARRKSDCPPAADVLASLPTGPDLKPDAAVVRHESTSSGSHDAATPTPRPAPPQRPPQGQRPPEPPRARGRHGA